MQYLSSGPEDESNHRLVRAENLLFPETPRQPYPAVDGVAEEASSFQAGRLLRKYWLLLLSLMLLGAAGGFVSVILSSPMYKSKLMLEVQSSNGLLRPGEGGNAETTEEDIQTQVARSDDRRVSSDLVILSSPMYKSKLMLEVQSSNGLLRPGEGGNAETTEVDIQTQVQ